MWHGRDALRDALPCDPRQHLQGWCRAQRLRWSMRSGASGVARRCMSRHVFCRFCHARSRVPMVFGLFHCCAFCRRAPPDAPETIDDQRRCTGCRYRTIYGGSRGSASLPAERLGPIISTVHTNDSTLTETKAFGSVLFQNASWTAVVLKHFPGQVCTRRPRKLTANTAKIRIPLATCCQ